MTGLLFENPWPLIAMLAITAVLLTAGALKTGRAALIYAAVGTLALAVLVFVTGQWVVTPREEVASTLRQIAADLEANDGGRVRQHICSSAAGLQDEVSAILPRIEIHRATVKPNLTVDVMGSPPSAAKARFNGVIVASERRGHLKNQHGAFFFEVDFRLEDGRWKIWNYSRKDPREGMR